MTSVAPVDPSAPVLGGCPRCSARNERLVINVIVPTSYFACSPLFFCFVVVLFVFCLFVSLCVCFPGVVLTLRFSMRGVRGTFTSAD